MIEIFWVEDYLSGETLEGMYYSTREEATARRNELGYGIVKSWKRRDDMSFYEEAAGRKIVVFTDPE